MFKKTNEQWINTDMHMNMREKNNIIVRSLTMLERTMDFGELFISRFTT